MFSMHNEKKMCRSILPASHLFRGRTPLHLPKLVARILNDEIKHVSSLTRESFVYGDQVTQHGASQSAWHRDLFGQISCAECLPSVICGTLYRRYVSRLLMGRSSSYFHSVALAWQRSVALFGTSLAYIFFFLQIYG